MGIDSHAPTTSQSERRGAPRARVRLSAIEYRGEDTFSHEVEYLSATGMLMRDASFTLDRLLETSDLELEIGLPGRRSALRVRGRIVRVDPTEDGEPGVGVEFLDLGGHDSDTLDIYVRGVLDGRASARISG